MVDVNQIAMRIARCAVFALGLLGTLAFGSTAQAQSERTMRVRLLADQSSEQITVRAQGGAVDVFSGDAAGRLVRLQGGESVTLSRRAGELRLSGEEVDLFALELQFAPAGKAAFELRGDALSGEPTAYPGTLVARSSNANRGALRLINRVSLQTYVASVVGSEYGLRDEEGAKAMAVAVRTYALRAAEEEAGSYDLGDQVWSQRYEGTRGLSKATLRAARATRGQVLTHDGALIEAAYFSSSGGHTASNENVWEGEARPYLRGKPDPYDEAASPHIPWTQRFSRRKLLDALTRAFEGRVTGFVIDSRSPDGRVEMLELLRRDDENLPVSGPRFRRVVNQNFGYETLLSTFFDARRAGSRYVFEGKGFGHGVGLSQWGAHEMARQDHSYEDILHFYYTDVALGSVKEAERKPVAQAELNDQDDAAEDKRQDEAPAETTPENESDKAAAAPPLPSPSPLASAQIAADTLTTTPPPDSTARAAAADTTAASLQKDDAETTKRIGW
jgi:stage II sporulation protein D